MCVDASKPSGECCATCPNGRNCRIPSTGEVISAGLPVYRNGMRCECPPQSHALPGIQRPEHYTAVCKEVATTTPPFTTIP
ncbi:hypothetical protein V1264_009479 [Littorina saxatilis]|uniref:Uncharacterized protein n=1 Tax=Littorina saxatilis TaxID=31220 RepID=A0AAN9ART4_9CAEN